MIRSVGVGGRVLGKLFRFFYEGGVLSRRDIV